MPVITFNSEKQHSRSLRERIIWTCFPRLRKRVTANNFCNEVDAVSISAAFRERNLNQHWGRGILRVYDRDV